MDASEQQRLAQAMRDWSAQLLAQPGPMPSPCVSVCQMADGLCQGCWRTLDEIASWGQLHDGQRRLVWQRIAQRLTTPEEGSA